MTPEQIDAFINKGFVRINEAFSKDIAIEAREILWRDLAVKNDPGSWTAPVIRLGEYAQEPFAKAASGARLTTAFDQLIGAGYWAPRVSLGTFPVRFPSLQPPQDDGWHVDASFAGDEPTDYLQWRINSTSKGRALLMLFLFSDVGEDDAPTRIRVGSHRDVAKILAPHGERGLSFMELAGQLDKTAHREVEFATGPAGTVYLCHPFLVHAAQAHRGRSPKFMAQPPLLAHGALPADSLVLRAIKE